MLSVIRADPSVLPQPPGLPVEPAGYHSVAGLSQHAMGPSMAEDLAEAEDPAMVDKSASQFAPRRHTNGRSPTPW
jgi:hypothetical protein